MSENSVNVNSINVNRNFFRLMTGDVERAWFRLPVHFLALWSEPVSAAIEQRLFFDSQNGFNGKNLMFSGLGFQT